jgi:hypothetical protein
MLYPRGRVKLPVGELTPTEPGIAVSSVMASVVEHLEAEQPNGEPEILVATSGKDLIDDLADVASFALNSTFSRDYDLVRRLVPQSLAHRTFGSPANLFRGTFDPSLTLLEPELEDLREFMTRLLELDRRHYEAAMRAIRRIVRATRRAADDPTIAYADIVAALESLSADEDAPAPRWEQLDQRKRNLIDAALSSAGSEVSEAVRQSVMEAERLGAANRFVQFVLGRVSPSFFRGEAVDAIRPIRRADLERALKLAYDVRSRNVHSLLDLPPEAAFLGTRADTVSLSDLGTILGLEGLARLARHVVRAYVIDSPTGVDAEFDWRGSVPGKVVVPVAPQYWVHQAAGLNHASAGRYFHGFVEHLLDAPAGREPAVTDMREVLARVEKLVPGTADGSSKTQMVAMYVLWHRIAAKDAHRPSAEAFIERNAHHLRAPTITAFVIGLLTRDMPDWSTDELVTLAEHRSTERVREKASSLPAPLDAALQVQVAERLVAEERRDEAANFARRAVDELPGNEALIAWELALGADHAEPLDIWRLLLGLSPEDTTPPQGGASSEAR